jgi:hypothetical protein
MQPCRTAIALGCALVAVPGVARAQMISPMLYEGPRIALQDHADRLSGDQRNARAPARPAAEAAALHYTPSGTRRSANLAAFVEKTRAADPGAAADLQRLFAKGDIIARIGALVAPHGLHIDNVADAYAMWWLTAWQAAHGRKDDPQPAIVAAVRAQATRAVSATGEIAHATDAQKQELAEALWLQSLLVEIAVEQARQDPMRLRAVGDAVRRGARGTGLDLDAIALTSKGFVPAPNRSD